MTKLNWERVHKEDLERRRKAKYPRLTTRGVRLSNLKRNRTKSCGTPMPGCTCGKTVGFTQLHNKSCPLSRMAPIQPTLPIRPIEPIATIKPCKKVPTWLVAGRSAVVRFVLSDFMNAIRATGYKGPLRKLLTDCAKMLENPNLDLLQRKRAQSAVRAMFEQLEEPE
jgi:hypothetical protein